ncbi:PTS system, mannose-specific IIC component [Enterococcus sp. HSIEG1]|nr:PTS system, mannose-specific IIC component [Enterococcus sp. HSIEG1]
MGAVVNAIPSVITDGLSIATGMLPAIGFAMLARMVMNKEVVPFFFLGFVLSAYFQIPVVGIAIIGLITIFVKINFTTSKNSDVAFAEGSEDIDDDF